MFDIARITGSGLAGHLDYHDSIGSTSDRALELAAQDAAPLPLLVLALRQTGGRGRGANRWWSADGALTFSLALEADAPPEAGTFHVPSPEKWPRLSLVVGLAVCEALESLVPHAEWRVKWPNDVFVNGGKICGVLAESVAGWRGRLVMGIGINVNNSLAAAPAEIRQSARALCDLGGHSYDLTEVLLTVLHRLDLRLRDLAAEGFPRLAEAHRSRCLLAGKTVTVRTGSQKIIGVCRGIDPDGILLVVTESGVERIVSGSIDSWE